MTYIHCAVNIIIKAAYTWFHEEISFLTI